MQWLIRGTDKFRTEARRHAWYNQEGDKTPNYNPFGRSRRSRHQGGDLENLNNHSETCLPDSILINPDGDAPQPGPHHASTMPPMSAGANNQTLFEKELESGTAHSHSHNSHSPHSHSHANAGERSIQPFAMSDESQPKPRKRTFIQKLTRKNKEAEVSRVKTTESAKRRQKFTIWGQVRAVFFSSWINILLVAAPVGIALHSAKVNPIVIFVVNFIAIIPLAAMLSYATEEIALRVGETLGGLMNATFGNAVELIVSIIALTKREVLIVKTSLIGSILSNLLLVLGMCFFAGGITRVEQFFNVTVAQTASSLLALSVGSLIIPTAFHSWSTAGDAGIKELSRGTAILLLFVYGCYLFFQLSTHADMYNEPSKKAESKRSKPEGASRAGIASIGRGLAGGIGGQTVPAHTPDDADEPELHLWTAIATLGISTTFVALCAEFMVGSIDAVTEHSGISKTFVGLILLPIVGNAAEHATAVTVAIKDKMDLAIGVAVGSSMQIALLVIPFVVVLGWILRIDDMTLFFDGFQIAILFVAVLLVNYLIQDGKSHWLEGVLLMSTYLIISVAAWFYPNVDSAPK